MKKLINSVAISSILALGLLSGNAHAEKLDGIVAVVNDNIILESELATKVEAIQAQYRSQRKRAPSADQLRKTVLQKMIDIELQMQRAQAAGMKVGRDLVNQNVQAIAKRSGLGLRDFVKALRRQGVDYADFREDLKREILVRRVKAKDVDRRIRVTEQEIKDALLSQGGSDSDKEYRLHHILLSIPEGATAAQVDRVRSKARIVLQRLNEGADFEKTAVAFSNGQRALYGGDMGWRKAAKIPTELAKPLAKLSKGELSKLIRTQAGFHILRLDDTRDAAREMVKETQIRHILIRTGGSLEDRAVKRKIDALHRRILAGEDFAELATQESEDPVSATKGGDLGWAKPGMFVPEFDAAAASLEKGEVSEPVQTQFGWHILQVLDRRERDATEENRRAQVVQSIRERKVNEETELWLRRLRDEAYVELR